MHQRLTNSSAKPASGPEYSVPATGCAGTKCTVFGRCGRHVAHHRALDRADVGDDRAGRKMRADLLGDRAAGADRNADDDEVGAFDRGGVGLDHLIGDAEFGDAPARLRRTRGGDDRAHRALRPRGARDRGADQPDADQRQAVEQGRRVAHAALPQKSVERLAPPAGWPPRCRRSCAAHSATVAGDRRRISPRLVRNASASAAVRPLLSGNGSARNSPRSASP